MTNSLRAAKCEKVAEAEQKQKGCEDRQKDWKSQKSEINCGEKVLVCLESLLKVYTINLLSSDVENHFSRKKTYLALHPPVNWFCLNDSCFKCF